MCLISEVVSAALVSYDTCHPMLPLLLSIRNETKLTKLNMQSREHLKQSFNFRVFIKSEFLFLVNLWDGAHVEKASSFKTLSSLKTATAVERIFPFIPENL